MKYLVTGITGSWGQCLTQRLLEDSNTELIIGLSRGEYQQVMMNRQFNDDRLRMVIGDVRDYEAVYNASKGVDCIVHLSALKHLPIAEKQPREAILTNILGVENVINASIVNKVKTVVDISTDKACWPNGVYGATKLIGERLIRNANLLSSTRFIALRSGNVLGTAGSVVPLFIEQLKHGNILTVTNCAMTRFFISLPDAIELLIKAITLDIGQADLIVTKMPSCTIGDLAEVIMDKYAYHRNAKIEEIGSRPNEKLHELLINSDEALNTYTLDDNYYLVSNQPLSLSKVNFKEYGSNTQPLMNHQEILTMLGKGGF